jgi:hypothetical protein
MRHVTVLLRRTAVTPRPAAKACSRPPNPRDKIRLKSLPNARCTPLRTMCTPQSSRATAPATSRTLKVPCIGLLILCLEARRPASDLPNPIDVSNWVGRHAGAVIAIIVANKKGGPKAAPSPARFERPGTPQGVATAFAVQNRAEGLTTRRLYHNDPAH